MGVRYLRCHVHSYVPQVNSSNPSVVNCSLIEDYVCGDARRRAGESGGAYSIASCSSVCCIEQSCNVHPTTAPTTPTDNENTSTAASTTVNGNGTNVQSPCLGLLWVMLAIGVAMKKVDEYF